MKYKIDGSRIVDVPKKAIENGMKELELSEQDAARMWLEDEGYIFPEDKSRIEKTDEKPIKRNAKSDAPRKKSTRERKVDENKKRYLNDIKVLLEGLGCENVQMHNEVSIDFSANSCEYSLKLIKHRPPKA